MKSVSILLVLVAQFVAAQEKRVPVFFYGPENVLVDTALWREHNLRSAAVTRAYNENIVIAFFETDSQNRPVAEYKNRTLTYFTYSGNRLATQVIHKNVYMEYLNVPHEIDSIFYSYPNANTVVVTTKQNQLGSTRNERNAANNEQWYLMRWEDVDWGNRIYVSYSYAFVTRIPSYMYGTYPNGAYRVPTYDNQYVLDEKFKTDYTDTALYCIRQIEEARVNDSVVSTTETVEPDVAFTPPSRNDYGITCGGGNYHYSDVYSTNENIYHNDLLTSIVEKTYRTDDSEFPPKQVFVSSQTLYRITYSFFDR